MMHTVQIYLDLLYNHRGICTIGALILNELWEYYNNYVIRMLTRPPWLAVAYLLQYHTQLIQVWICRYPFQCMQKAYFLQNSTRTLSAHNYSLGQCICYGPIHSLTGFEAGRRL